MAINPHNAERLILIGCHDAASQAHALRLHLMPAERELWHGQALTFLNDTIKYDSTTCVVFVDPAFSEWPETRAIAELVAWHYKQARINQNTVESIGEQQGRNFIRNLRLITRADGEVRSALDALPSMAGRTAIVCGAGPSFEQSGRWVARHPGPIIAVNTSAGACAQADVRPHVVVCTESRPVREGIERMNPERSHFAMDLIGASDNWWDTAHDSETLGSGCWQPQLAFIGTEPNLAPYARQLGMLPLAYGSSCTTAAVSLALAAGAARVVLVGQDCAFQTDNRPIQEGLAIPARMYASGTPYEETVVAINPFTKRAVIVKPTVGTMHHDVVEVPAVEDDRLVWTTHSMMSFAHWFRDQPSDVRARIVNCTSAGAHIEGIVHAQLADCIERDVPRYDLRAAHHGALETLGFVDRAAKLLRQLENAAVHGMGITRDGTLLEWGRKHPILNMWVSPERLRMRRQDMTAEERGHRVAAVIRVACSEIVACARGEL